VGPTEQAGKEAQQTKLDAEKLQEDQIEGYHRTMA
jgi:hypothetical protein